MFTRLTIGDGLVSQVPAFLISLAAGLIVTRSSTESDLGKDVLGQFFSRPIVLGVAAAFLGLLAFTGAAEGADAHAGRGAGLRRVRADGSRRGPRRSSRTSRSRPWPHDPPSDRMEDLLQVDPLELEIGFRLIGLADSTRGGDLLDRIRSVRQTVARELGLIVPQVRIRDEMGLGSNDYSLKIRGTAVGRGTAYCGPPARRAAGRDGRQARRPRRRRPRDGRARGLDPRRRPRGRRACGLPPAGGVGRGRGPLRRGRPQPCRRAADARPGPQAARSRPRHVGRAGR